MVYNITTDEYSVISIGGGYKYVAQNTLPEINFVAQVGKIVTNYPTFYYSLGNANLVPVFNLVIKVSNGAVTDLYW
jgi:hypothetical protein